MEVGLQNKQSLHPKVLFLDISKDKYVASFKLPKACGYRIALSFLKLVSTLNSDTSCKSGKLWEKVLKGQKVLHDT